MFLSGRERKAKAGGTALTGPVTLPGETAGAWLEGERRSLTVYAPGGYHWVPGLGDEVLVLKAGESGENPCAVGVSSGGQGLFPGEVLISAGQASIKLGLDGKVAITGGLTVNGIPVALQATEGAE